MFTPVFFFIAILCFIAAFLLSKETKPSRYVQLQTKEPKELSLVKSKEPEELGPIEIKPAKEEEIIVEKKKKKEWAPLSFFKE